MNKFCTALFFSVVLHSAFISQCFSQGKNDISKEITFLKETPVIDGILDNNLSDLPVRKFSSTEKTDDKLPNVPAEYRIAYGIEFLYLYIEYSSDSLVKRDRAYQNGDGFHIAITKPKPNNEPANEFYLLGFSPGYDYSFVWYKNIDLSFVRLKNAKLTYTVNNHNTGVELLLPWGDVYPYHPFFSVSIGFNMCFVKAVGDKDMIYYFVRTDEKMQSEQSTRLYEKLKFEKPGEVEDNKVYAVFEKNNIKEKENIKFLFTSLAKKIEKKDISFSMESSDGTGEVISEKDIGKILNRGNHIYESEINTSGYHSSDYKINWKVLNSSGEISFTILPDVSVNEMSERIDKIKNKISTGSFNTLMFRLNDITDRLKKKKDYDVCTNLRNEISETDAIISQAESGTDYYSLRKGLFRRAYLSRLDKTFQPYSVKIPENYIPGKKYPLIIFLHGSGGDDRGYLSSNDYSQGKCIEMAPNGRGTSNCYSTPESLDDIYEAIEDAANNYSIDTSKIIIEGFSMGGYGVYRLFYEYPVKFKAAAVFSGHPDLANKWLGGRQINFLDEKNLGVFNNIPIFIFHGIKDRNCAYEVTLELIEKLKNAGANVLFCNEDIGHSSPSKETMNKYYSWLEEIIK